MASAVLALTFPDDYRVAYFRGWRALFGEDRREFTTSQYLTYRAAADCVAHMLDWSVQERNHALWELGRRTHVQTQRPSLRILFSPDGVAPP